MGPTVQYLSGGKRLHLQHGPIDLIIGADGEREVAFRAAERRFETVLEELARELTTLRKPVTSNYTPPTGETALRMDGTARAFLPLFVTPMAAVAGSVAETVLAAMTRKADLTRAYVNNGGDIALHLAAGQRYATAIKAHDGRNLGVVKIAHDDPVRGIATSGRHGRSLSLGIADSVTVLASSAAKADIAATLIANAVDLPGHPAIERQRASDVVDDGDLGDLPVVTGCGIISQEEILRALKAGRNRADGFISRGLITSASLHLNDETLLTGTTDTLFESRTLAHA